LDIEFVEYESNPDISFPSIRLVDLELFRLDSASSWDNSRHTIRADTG